MSADEEFGDVVPGPELPFIRSPYNYDRDAVSVETGLLCQDPSLAVQEARDEADINVLVERFGLTGKFPEGAVMPVYGDFYGLSSYHDAANAIAQANETFDSLPAAVRARFVNDPGEFVDFALNPENRAQLLEWGMVEPSAEQGSPPVVSPGSPPSPSGDS